VTAAYDQRNIRFDGEGSPVFQALFAIVVIVVLIRRRHVASIGAADRAGVYLTGQPSSLASALTKISGEMGRIPVGDLRQAEAFNAFFFAPAIAKGFSLSSVFSTHPSLEKRLEQLGRISADLSRPS